MIRIKQHPNFSNWFNVFDAFGRLIEQANCQSQALEIAKDYANANKATISELDKWEKKANGKHSRVTRG